MISLWMDLKYSWRTAQRQPIVTFIILILLALGTGGLTTTFNSIYSLVLAAPPFPQPDRLVIINENLPLFNQNTNEIVNNNSLEYLFSNLATYTIHPYNVTLTYDNTEEFNKINYIDVTEDFFGTLGVLPLYGNDFVHGGRGIIVSNKYWRNVLKGSDDVIGKPVKMGSSSANIVGVMPDTFDFPVGTDIWLYLGKVQNSGIMKFIGRLRPGISIEQAARELKNAKFEPRQEINFGNAPVLKSINTVFYGDKQPQLLMQGTTTVLFLLLVCFGIMNIYATRWRQRKPEIAMRMAFGATRRNLVFQVLRETLPLIIFGTLIGVWFSEIVGAWLLVQYPMLKGGEVVVPIKITFFIAAVLTVSIISVLAPVLYFSDINLNEFLKSSNISKRKLFSLQDLLTGVQLGLTLAFLIGAGLLIRSMMATVDFPIGWNFQKTFVIETMTRSVATWQEFKNQLAKMPEVAAVGNIYPIPFSTDAVRFSQMEILVFKNPNTAWNKEFPNETAVAMHAYASPEVFKVLGISLVSGRFFTQADIDNESNIAREQYISGINSNTGRVAIVNKSLANKFWPEENAVGKIIYDMDLVPYEIVGVLYDFYQVVDKKIIDPVIYYPATIISEVQGGYLVKLHSNSLTKSFQRGLVGMNNGLVYINIQSLDKLVSDSTAHMRLLLQFYSSFALLGILIAGLGVYATATLVATARNRENGIRMAMGANAWDIFMLAVWRGIRVIIIGLPVGLLIAWVLSRILSSFIFQLNANDSFV